MNKKSKAIKRLNKQVKKLNKRIDKMGKKIEGLAPEDAMAEGLQAEVEAGESLAAAEPEVAAPAAASYSAEELELARELTDEAEAVLDILEKEDEISAQKVSPGSKSGKKKNKKLKKKSKK